MLAGYGCGCGLSRSRGENIAFYMGVIYPNEIYLSPFYRHFCSCVIQIYPAERFQEGGELISGEWARRMLLKGISAGSAVEIAERIFEARSCIVI